MNDEKQTADDDFEYARQTYHDILAKGSVALDDMIDVAKATEHPRAFEVLSTLMKTMADVNGDLLSLHRKKKDLARNDPPPQSAIGNTTNNLFLGSTVELQKLLLDNQKNQMIEIKQNNE
jgi:hypothetical protein